MKPQRCPKCGSRLEFLSDKFAHCADCGILYGAEIKAKDKYIEAQDVIISGQRKEVEALKEQIAAMRRCEICKYYDNNYHDAPCVGCADKTSLPRWELAKCK
jgi:hypothetical protein